jgi:hypothetical protein
MGRVLFQQYGTQLRLEDDDQIVLSVMCGRTFAYDVEFVLSSDEYKAYKLRGDEFIKELSNEVFREPNRYVKRGLSSEENPYKSSESGREWLPVDYRRLRGWLLHLVVIIALIALAFSLKG